MQFQIDFTKQSKIFNFINRDHLDLRHEDLQIIQLGGMQELAFKLFSIFYSTKVYVEFYSSFLPFNRCE